MTVPGSAIPPVIHPAILLVYLNLTQLRLRNAAGNLLTSSISVSWPTAVCDTTGDAICNASWLCATISDDTSATPGTAIQLVTKPDLTISRYHLQARGCNICGDTHCKVARHRYPLVMQMPVALGLNPPTTRVSL